jgi:phosphatidylinositol alpha-mannosyltransferase
MKIGLVSAYDHAHPGGVKAHIDHLKNHFVDMGHQVKIMAPFSYEQPLKKDVIPMGRPIFYIPSGGSTARMNLFPRPWSNLKKILREENFDILHIHEPMLPWLPVNALRLSKTINIGTFHAYHPHSIGYTLWKPYLKNISFKQLHGVIAVSPAAREFHMKFFPGDYRIIPNGISYTHFAKEALPFERYLDGKKNILFVGRYGEKRKGLKYLLGAFKILKKRFEQIRLIIVGPGSKMARLLHGGNGEDVVFTGYAAYDDLPRYYRTADVFCAPATGAESFGIVLLEAMAAGAPVVASNIKGYAGVVDHGKDGFLIQPMDEEALAGALAHVLENDGLKEKMRANGKIKAERYRWTNVSRQVMNFYIEIMRRYGRKV